MPMVTPTARRRNWRRLSPLCSSSADSAPPPVSNSYSCGVRSDRSVCIAIRAILPWFPVMPGTAMRADLIERSEIEIDVLPRPDPLPAGTPEEAPCQHRHREEERKDREKRDRELAILEGAAGIAIDVGQYRQRHQHEARQQHASHSRWEVVQLFLQPQEIPRGLGGIWRQVRIGVIAQWRIHHNRDQR